MKSYSKFLYRRSLSGKTPLSLGTITVLMVMRMTRAIIYDLKVGKFLGAKLKFKLLKYWVATLAPQTLAMRPEQVSKRACTR